MTTAGDIIRLALKDAQVLDESETPSAALMADGLTTLNQLLSMWQTPGLIIYGTTELLLTPTGVQSYTIGLTGADITAESPQRINYAYLRINDVTYPFVKILPDRGAFESYAITTVLGTFPDVLYFNNEHPNGIFYLWPQPSTGTLHIGVDIQLPQYTLAPNDFSLGREYEMPMRFNLAKLLAVMNNLPVSKDLENLANSTLRVLKRSNVRLKELQTSPYTGRSEKTDFYSGFVR